MHEDLVGYLLGALEPHEMRRVAEALRVDPKLRAELAQIQEALRPLEDAYEPPAAPSSDLVARTLDNLPPLPHLDTQGKDAQPKGDQESSPEGEPVIDSVIDAVIDAGQAAEAPGSLTPMANASGWSGRSSMNWLDWVSGSVAVAILLGLLLPAIAQGRFESRKAACQDQLRSLGTALTSFVNRDSGKQLPAVSPNGREAFAGVYAVRLHDAGLLEESGGRWCPSMNPPSTHVDAINVHRMVSLNELHSAPINQLKEIQRVIGGHYAYTLGVVDEDGLAAPRFKARTNFAVMSDAPMAVNQGRVDAQQIGHSGRGINVLYEDGHTQFYSLESLSVMPDHPLMNHRGETEAGVDADDASLAPSWRGPFVDVKQR